MSGCSDAREAEAPPRLVRSAAGSGGLESLRRALSRLGRSILRDSDDIEDIESGRVGCAPMRPGGGKQRIRFLSSDFFGKGSLLRNEPQYPTRGYAPHSGRGGETATKGFFSRRPEVCGYVHPDSALWILWIKLD